LFPRGAANEAGGSGRADPRWWCRGPRGHTHQHPTTATLQVEIRSLR